MFFFFIHYLTFMLKYVLRIKNISECLGIGKGNGTLCKVWRNDGGGLRSYFTVDLFYYTVCFPLSPIFENFRFVRDTFVECHVFLRVKRYQAGQDHAWPWWMLHVMLYRVIFNLFYYIIPPWGRGPRDATLIKNKIKFSTYIRKFRRDRLQIHIWGRAT
jgi:hypothetical protein